MRRHFLLYINNSTISILMKYQKCSNSGTYRTKQWRYQWWHTQKLEILHSKLQNLSEKYRNIKSTYSILQYLIISFYSRDIPTFNELVIKNTLLLLKYKTIFPFMEGFHLLHRQNPLTEGRTFHYKVPFPLNFISLKRILQWVKSRTRMFKAFYVSLLIL